MTFFVADKITEKEKQLVKIMKDPVLWLTEHVNEPRWYQKLVLRHPHHRTLLRMGRRLGKCIAGTERILDPRTGQYETIDALYQRGETSPHLYTLDKNDMVPAEAFHIEDNGQKEVFEVKTMDGSKVNLTGNHPVLTKNGWTKVDDLQKEDQIALPNKLPYKGTLEVADEEVTDYVQQNQALPEDIYEWSEENLERFLLTYSQIYGRYGSDASSIEGESIPFKSEERAREFKHLFLRVGYLTSVLENTHAVEYRRGYDWQLEINGTAPGDYHFVPLKSITSIGEQQTYDVHVPKTHNLVVEDVFVHNTWTMAGHMLWVAMTYWGGRLSHRAEKGIDILVVAPYDVQAKEIYDTLNDMIDNNDALSASLLTRRQGPPREIEFHNGSTIKLFTAGTSSSANAASIRGQRADSPDTL